jgi:hypothetical protein
MEEHPVLPLQVLDLYSSPDLDKIFQKEKIIKSIEREKLTVGLYWPNTHFIFL